MIRDRLLNRLPKERAHKVGVSAKDLQGFALTDDLKGDILAALSSKDSVDVKLGFFFAEQLGRRSGDKQFEDDLLKISLRLFDQNVAGVKSSCVAFLVLLGQKLENYRELMLRALKDDDAQVRREALVAYQTFAKRREVEPLEAFETDDYVTEIGMGSHSIYELRNIALETIEKVINCKFEKFEKTVAYKGNNVAFWWSWEPFHKWKSNIWRKFRL